MVYILWIIWPLYTYCDLYVVYYILWSLYTVVYMVIIYCGLYGHYILWFIWSLYTVVYMVIIYCSLYGHYILWFRWSFSHSMVVLCISGFKLILKENSDLTFSFKLFPFLVTSTLQLVNGGAYDNET